MRIGVDDPPGVDPTYNRKPPKGGLVVNVYARILDKDARGEFCHGSCDLNFQGSCAGKWTRGRGSGVAGFSI